MDANKQDVEAADSPYTPADQLPRMFALQRRSFENNINITQQLNNTIIKQHHQTNNNIKQQHNQTTTPSTNRTHHRHIPRLINIAQRNNEHPRHPRAVHRHVSGVGGVVVRRVSRPLDIGFDERRYNALHRNCSTQRLVRFFQKKKKKKIQICAFFVLFFVFKSSDLFW
jgi:hypothetical protein